MLLISRDNAKSALQKMGLFPATRWAYRRLNRKIREQGHREIDFYSAFAEPSTLCFDIGANLGQKTEVFLACGARVITVEPNPHCRSALEYNFAGNSQCELVFMAVGPSESVIELFTHLADSTAGARPDWDTKIFGIGRRISPVSVPMTTLDALIA